MQKGRQIIYMDETSTHLWEKMKSFWMPRDDLIDVGLNRERGESISIIGGISNRWTELKYIICGKTNTKCVLKFLEKVAPDIEKKNCVMIMDNHTAHHSRAVRDKAFRMGLTLEFMPPTASELNPIERMWGYFKRVWR